MTLSSPATVPSGEARPADAGERLVLLDALRGFALCGVFISNVYMWFNGRALTPPAQLKAAIESAPLVDTVTMHAVSFLVFGKFITLFSFLFGLGFAVQLGRAEERGASIAPLYARRLAVLFVLGLAHLFLLWYGDILNTYALLGFGLLLFRQRSDRTLLLWAAGFILVMPVVSTLLLNLPTLLAGSSEAAAALTKETGERLAAVRAQTLQTFSGGTWLETVRANATYFFQVFIRAILPVVFAIFGRFLLGLLAGRRRLFHDVPQHLPLFRKVLRVGAVVGVLCGGAGVVVQQLLLRKVLLPESLPWLPYVMGVVRQLAEVGLASVYVAAFTLLFQREAWQRVLSVLAPVGRMALTNYLCQTVISLALFYGFGLGLMGKLGPALSVALALGIFALQIGVSHLWLARFRFGPAEWVWRSLTYGKAQPLRRAAGPELAPAAAVS
jgi:uncharacterized protein